MSDDHFDWGRLFDWLLTFQSSGVGPVDLPKVEYKDGEEPTAESLREEARQADARAKTEKPRALTSHDRKALDKEFWDLL
jgi:hypothetical protein